MARTNRGAPPPPAITPNRVNLDLTPPAVVAEPAVVVEAPKKVVRRKKITTNPDDRIYIFSKEGGIVLDRTATGECQMAGWIEPEVFAQSIQIDKPIDSGIIAKNCIYFRRRVVSDISSHTIAMYQFDPTTITITYKHVDASLKKYTISMPYLQFYCKINTVQGQHAAAAEAYISCTKQPILSLRDPIYQLPINNVGSRGVGRAPGQICWGYDNPTKVNAETTPLGLGRARALQFFTSTFNNHLPPTIPSQFASAITTEASEAFYYKIWEKKTKENPKFIFDVDFVSIGTPESLMAIWG